MVRKVLAMAAVLTVVLGGTVVPSSAATVKSGVLCAKVNAVTKVNFSGDTYVYKCIKNPLYKKTKLTWTLQECIDSIKDYNSTLAGINKTKMSGGTPTTNDMTLLDTAKQLRDMSCAAGI